MKTTKKTTVNTSSILSEELYTIISDINEAILIVKKSQGTVFTLLKNAYLTLQTVDYGKVKERIDLHTSSINKMEQIFKNEFVMGNLEKLPISWGTLSELALMDGDVLLAKIASSEINKKTTKDEASKIRKASEELAKAENEDKVEAATTESEDKVEAAATTESEDKVEAAATSESEDKVEAAATTESEDKVEAAATTAFTFTMKESAKSHKKDIKALILLMEEYFEIPSNLELFFNEVVA